MKIKQRICIALEFDVFLSIVLFLFLFFFELAKKICLALFSQKALCVLKIILKRQLNLATIQRTWNDLFKITIAGICKVRRTLYVWSKITIDFVRVKWNSWFSLKFAISIDTITYILYAGGNLLGYISYDRIISLLQDYKTLT